MTRSLFQRSFSALLVMAAMACLARAEAPLTPAPVVPKGDVVDDYFGTRVPDPYRALEDESLPETQAFIAANNARTRSFIDSPQREQIKTRITELYDVPRQSAPQPKGKNLFFSTNSGLQNQSIFRVSDRSTDEGRVLIDPNRLSPDGTISIDDFSPSDDGALLAYGLSQSGSDHSEMHVMDVASGRDLPDVLPPARQSAAVWLSDNGGFYYGKCPKTPEHGREEKAYNYQIFFHKLGTPATDDRLIYERPDDRELSFGIDIPEDGQYEFMTLEHGTRRENRFYFRPAAHGADQPWTKLIDNEDFVYRPIEGDGPLVYVLTTDGAPRSRLIAIDLRSPQRENWKELIPQSEDSISAIRLIGEKLVVTYMHDAHEVLKIFDKNGKFQREVKLPTIGTVGQLGGQRKSASFFYSFTSFSYPTTIYEYDLASDKSTVVYAPKVKFDPADYETTQRFATSKDGTKIPVFITYKKGVAIDGSARCLLYGYGGFHISTTPSFSPARMAWLERGGIYASASIRGGGEYGDAWHKAALFEKRQNAYDDFAASAEMLVREKYTSTPKLAIQGGSNGGLLVAACMLQRPDLYGAVICQVPVADMLRYPKLGIGRFWTVEFGDASASPEQFKTLRAYSPLHNVKAGQTYPPILITTGEGDNRVVPGHSYKFAATLQANTADPNPVLLRIESKAGHGGGKPTTKIIDESADIYAFLMKVLK
ncbi:MAG TPA: prolyl oligopeptidase family serine peptidase [Tepidisphaeraceae bacterium]|jgi:prolyl oligopeptidase